jgi:hypothetical protein
MALPQSWISVGLPGIEVYRTTRVDASHEMSHTEIYLPVSRVKE